VKAAPISIGMERAYFARWLMIGTISLNHAWSAKAFDGRKVFLHDDDWLHIRFRNPEVGFEAQLLLRALIQPGEAYRNGRGGVHALMRIDEGHFLVVIYEPTNNEGILRTAYLTSVRRKERRYRQLLCLKRS
jgi:hypothetical protein